MRGGTGSGKTYHTYIRVLLRTISETPHIYLCLRKHGVNVKRSIWKGMLDMATTLGIRDQFELNKSDYTMTHINGNQIWFGGLDDPEKLKSIEGVTSVWMEEATEFKDDDFIELNRRFRATTPHHKEIIVTFNPIDKGNWVYKQFFGMSHRTDRTLYLHTTYKDNPFLDKDLVDEIKTYQETDPYQYEVYALGEWGILEGQIYRMWQMVDALPERIDETFYGLDFGYNNPTACIAVHVSDGKYYLEEILYETGLTVDDIANRLKEIGVKPKANIYCDAADPASIESLYRKGFNTHKANKDVLEGIRKVKEAWPDIYSIPANANLHIETESYKWKTDKNGNVLDEPTKHKDHILDALRYAMYTYRPGSQRTKVVIANRPTRLPW